MSLIYKQILIYGVLAITLISVFKFIQYLFNLNLISLDTLSFFIALVFIFVGFWINTKFQLNPNAQFNLESNKQPILHNDILTNREMDVLILLSKGNTNKQISEELYVSLNTTKTHLSNIYSKLGTRNRVQTIRTAQNQGLI